MPPRYIARRPKDDQHWSVWDNEKNRIAVFDSRECVDLGFNEALDTAERLNAEVERPDED